MGLGKKIEFDYFIRTKEEKEEVVAAAKKLGFDYPTLKELIPNNTHRAVFFCRSRVVGVVSANSSYNPTVPERNRILNDIVSAYLKC